MKFFKKYRYLRIFELYYNNISQFLFITQITKSREDDELYNFRRIFVLYIYIYILLHVKSVNAHGFNASKLIEREFKKRK